jgi:hypothetical protein
MDDLTTVLTDDGFVSLTAAREAIRLCNSYNRLPSVIELSWAMKGSDWLTLLGEEWSTCDNISEHWDNLLDTQFADLSADPLELRRHMMTPEEVDALEALPETVTVFRGCYAHNKRGLSWTLDEATARKFPLLHRYQQDGQPLLIRAEVARDKILALKLDRDEAEVIATRPKILAISHIKV